MAYDNKKVIPCTASDLEALLIHFQIYFEKP